MKNKLFPFATTWFRTLIWKLCTRIPICFDGRITALEENKKFGVKAAPAVETCLTKDKCQKHCPGWYCTGKA